MTDRALMSVSTAIRTRRSIRRFRPDPLPPALLHHLLDLALQAPSSWNYQARSIVVVADEAQRAALCAATGGQPQVLEAPATLVFVAESEAWRADQSDVYAQARSSGAWSEEFAASCHRNARDFQHGLAARGLTREYAVKDAMIAASFFLLAATEEGLATSPMNGWEEAEVKKVIGIDGADDLAVALLVAVGFPAERRTHPGRRPLERRVFRERYTATTGENGR